MSAIIQQGARRSIYSAVQLTAKAGGHGGGGHGGGYKLWKNLSLFGAIPACLLLAANVYMHHEHHERPPFIKYEHLYIRNKRYPWGEGVKSYFHNPHLNALPDGYEDE